MAKLTFHGGAREVTGANYLIETKNTKVLVDCGMAQGDKHARDSNYEPFPYDASQIDALLITHAHIDHTGRVPKLFKEGFKGRVLATYPTVDLMKIMLDDSAGLLAREAQRIKKEPLYSEEDATYVTHHAEGIEYGKEIIISPEIRVRFRDAGHILGSAIIEMWITEPGEDEIKIVFSGDLGNPPTPLLPPTEYIDTADYVLVESAYGNRLHENAQERKNILEDVIENTVARGGTLMIPAFAIERTQELLFELNELIEHHRIPRIPIFIDSPLAIKATEIYRKYEAYYNKKAKYIIESGDEVFKFPGLKMTRETDESKAIKNAPSPKIIVAGSGMSTGGRILHHEINYLPDPNSTLLIIGYQVHGTLGRRLLEGAREVTIYGKKVAVRAKSKAIGGYSAHADQAGLVNWVKNIQNVKHVYTVQGETEAALELAQVLKDHYGINASAPEEGDVVEL